MKIVSFHRDGQLSTGALLDGDLVLDFQHEAAGLPGADGPLDWMDTDGACHQSARRLVEGADVAKLQAAGAVLPLAGVELLSPIPRPGKVICIGLNYRDHAEESGMEIPKYPLVFSKFSSCVVGQDADVKLPRGAKEVDYEAEFGVVIGKTATDVSEADAMDHVLGYCNINDVSARDFQFADGQWQRGKSCETFCPTGPFIATADEIADPHELRIQFRMNGKTLQDSSTSQLIFNVPELVSYLSGFVTLEPGDLISTGTPPGVGFAHKPPIYIQPGDLMEVEVEGLGVLRNKAVSAD
ncbi:fumarylacetoacetate hydrolase family protein [Planctomycetes bacterium Poly30]|uniref:fumarylacetoacetate hydrolase family protein n=1 Tax=Saltatorellus ferox TaxID=2528018 RepID=UPI0011A1BE27